MPLVNKRASVLTRSFQAGAARFAVRCRSDDVRALLERLFAEMATGVDSASSTEISLWETEAGTVGIENQVSSSLPAQAALTSVVTTVTRLSLDADPDRLHLHCAGLARAGRGILISAPSGTGKSTLTGALMLDGWSYVSDGDWYALERASCTAYGFPKPLMIKPGGGELLPELADSKNFVEFRGRRLVAHSPRLHSGVSHSELRTHSYRHPLQAERRQHGTPCFLDAAASR